MHKRRSSFEPTKVSIPWGVTLRWNTAVRDWAHRWGHLAEPSLLRL